MAWFHGRPARSRRFAFEFVGGEAANDQEGPGFYFTTDVNEARGYAAPNGVVLEAELAVPKWVPTTGRPPSSAVVGQLMRRSPCYHQVLEDWDEHPGRAARAALAAMTRAQDPPHQTFLGVWADFYLRCGENAAYLRGLVAMGYGGVQIHWPEKRLDGKILRAARAHAVVFDPRFIQNVRVVEDRGGGPIEGLGLHGFGGSRAWRDRALRHTLRAPRSLR